MTESPKNSERADDHDFPTFIDSSPLGEDLLEGKAQEKIAASIADLIRTNRTKNRLVGLDGAWGSGKSNLIKIIESNLNATHHVFTYDAWGHQEDLQRRSLLEELTDDLCDNRIVNPDTWTAKLKDLLARKRETETKTNPQLSNGVIITLLITILTAISKSIADGLDAESIRPLVTALPLTVGVLMYFIASIRKGYLLTPTELYAVYKEQDQVSKTHVTISEKEPSVREFQSWMRELSLALGAKKLVIVFDNMDRLPTEKVRELWSSIHTFFSEESFDGIWVIIPFDRTHILEAFKNDEVIADQFLRKSFSVVYRVAPPVLTDWHKFYERMFQEAFVGKDLDEMQVTRRVFDTVSDQITPRNIIAFINEMISLRLAVEEDILLRYIAIFVLTKTSILKAPVDQILNLNFLGNASALFSDDDDLPNYIAALVYQVPLASASQVTLTREIENSLRDKNGARINELSKHRHFVDILEQVVSEGNIEPEGSASTIAVLDDDVTKGDAMLARFTRIWDDISEQEIRSPLSRQTVTETHRLLLKNSSKKSRSDLLRYIVVGLRNVAEFSGAEYYKSLSDLAALEPEETMKTEVLALVTEIKKTPDVFIDYVRAAGSDYKTYKMGCDGVKLTTHICDSVPDGLNDFSGLSTIKGDYDFERVIERLEEEIAKDTLTAANFEPLYKLYKSLAAEKPIKIIGDAQINALTAAVDPKSDAHIDLLAMRIARMQKYPAHSGAEQNILTETDESMANRIAERIEYYANYGDLLIGLESWPQPILKLILRDLTFKNYGVSRLSIVAVLKKFKPLYELLSLEPEDFIRKLEDWSEHAIPKVSAENVAETIPDYEFFEFAINVDGELSHHAIVSMIDYLNSLGVEDWQEPLHDTDSYLFNVTYRLLQGKRLKNVPDNAVAVYKEVLMEFARGEFELDIDDGWEVIFERTNGNKLKATAKNIRDMFIADTAIDADKFLVLAELLVKHGSLKAQSADVTRKILAPVVSNDKCLTLILENSDFFTEVVNQARDDADDLKDVIRQKISATEVDDALAEFARAIGIESATDVGNKESE